MKRNLFVALLLLLLVGMPESYGAKRRYLRNYQVEDGLSQNMVYCILQDRQGFMWFGTQDGLNRFDGRNFKVYKSSSANPKSIVDDGCFALMEDSRGAIWVGTGRGVSIYNPSSERFDRFGLIDDSGYKAEGTARDIFTDANGNIWIVVAEQGLFRVDSLGTKKFFPISNSIECSLRAAIADSEGNLWIGTYGGGLLRFSPESGNVEQYLLARSGGESNDINDLLLLNDRTLLVGSSLEGLLTFDTKTYEFGRYAPLGKGYDNLFVRKIVRSRDGELWLGTETGVYVCNPLGTTPVAHISHANNDPYSLSDNAAHTIYEDAEGGIWIGTYFGGVNYIGSHSSDFEKFYPIGGRNSISGKCISEFCGDSYGRLWIATEDAGLNLYDPSTGLFRSGFVPAKNIHSLHYHKGKLWVGTFSDGLYVLSVDSAGKTTIERHYDSETSLRGLDSNSIYAMTRDEIGQLWVGTIGGLFLYDNATDTFGNVLAKGINSRVNDILQDAKGVMWVATTRNGVWTYDKVEAEWKQHLFGSTESGRTHNSINTLLECSNGDIVAGTNDGIFLFNAEREEFVKYKTAQSGLPNNVVLKLIEDGQGGIWGSTNNGLFRLSRVENKITTYTHYDGLLCNQFNNKSGYRDKSGTIYFGGIKGFVSFDPERVLRARSAPRMVFNSLEVNGHEAGVGVGTNPVLEKSITLTDKIVIPPTITSFSLGLATLGYDFGGDDTYAYKLEGFDKRWLFNTSGRITYSNLPYGKYRLVVNQVNGKGTAGEPLQLRVVVKPPLHKTLVARILYLFMLVGVVVMVVIFVNRRRKKLEQDRLHKLETQKERELYDAKIAFFTNITHEIRTPLSLIKMPLEEVLKSVDASDPNHDNLQIIHNNTNRILKLVNELLDFRKVEADGLKVNYVHINVCGLMKSRVENFRPAARTKDINIRWSVVDDEMKADVDPEIFTKIFDNLMGNALNHAKSLIEVSLRANKAENRFVVGVANDGATIEESLREKIFEPFFKVDAQTAGTGLGLPFVRSLTELCEGNVYVADSSGAMTQFVVELPLVQQGTFSVESHSAYDKELPAEVPEQSKAAAAEPVADEVEMPEEIDIDKRPTVLLVEDNEEFLEFVATQLKGNYKIIKAYNGVEALQRLEESYVDVIVSDLAMPQMNGQELCVAVKEKLLYSHIPFIMLTADTSLRSKMEGLKVGADEYIEKPFSTEYLVLRINNLMSSRKKIVDSYKHSPEMMFDTIVHSKADEYFLNRIVEIIHRNIEKSDLNVDMLAEEMNMSRATLYRKLKSISELTPTKFIHLIRLKRAAEMLKHKEYRVNEVAFIVGFSSSSYFSKCFYKQFGVLPKDYS